MNLHKWAPLMMSSMFNHCSTDLNIPMLAARHVLGGNLLHSAKVLGNNENLKQSLFANGLMNEIAACCLVE